jgi:hypothetical protein
MALITMSKKELGRLETLVDLDEGRITAAQAAGLIGVGERQVFRLLKAYRTRGGPAPWEWRDGIRTSCGFEHGDPFHAGPCLERGAIAQGRVQALPIVEDFDVVEHGCPGFLTRAEAGVVDVLLLE